MCSKVFEVLLYRCGAYATLKKKFQNTLEPKLTSNSYVMSSIPENGNSLTVRDRAISTEIWDHSICNYSNCVTLKQKLTQYHKVMSLIHENGNSLMVTDRAISTESLDHSTCYYCNTGNLWSL